MVLERQIERHGLVLPKDHSETQTDEETPDAKVRLFGLRLCNFWTDCIDVASVFLTTKFEKCFNLGIQFSMLQGGCKSDNTK